jgi:DNA-binding MarR family transcriptional regulator
VEEAVAAIRAWQRLSNAMVALNRDVQQRHGVTGAQLALLRLLDEWDGRETLLDVRTRLAMHPATLGQLVERLHRVGLVRVDVDPQDRGAGGDRTHVTIQARRIGAGERRSAVAFRLPAAGAGGLGGCGELRHPGPAEDGVT